MEFLRRSLAAALLSLAGPAGPAAAQDPPPAPPEARSALNPSTDGAPADAKVPPAPPADAWQTVAKIDKVDAARVQVALDTETDRLRILITKPSGAAGDDVARVAEVVVNDGFRILKPSAVRADSASPGFEVAAAADGQDRLGESPPQGWFSARLPQSTPRWLVLEFPKPLKTTKLTLWTAAAPAERVQAFEVQVPQAAPGVASATPAGTAGDGADARSPGLRPWTTGPMVPRRSSQVAPMVSVGNWLVCVDGSNDDCYGARQLADGKLSPWQTLKDWGYGGVNHGSGSVMLGDVAYNVGISGYTRRIRAQGDGVSKWEFPVPGDKIDPKDGRPREMVWGSAAAVAAGGKTFLYYIAGFEYKGGSGKNPSDLEVIYYAESPAPGELGPWKPTTSLPYPVMSPAGVGYNGRVYVLGGNQKFIAPTRQHDEILCGKVNPDGSIPKWTQVGKLPRPMEGVAAFQYGGWLYALGGQSGKKFAECWRAPIAKTGEIGAWQPQPPFPKPLSHCPCAVIGRYVYVIGELEDNKQAPVYISRL